MAGPGSNDYELRLALGIRGGVSLAVWIGGVCAELDRVRRADAKSPDARPEELFWGEVLDHSPYDCVAIDVIAGASAGGLNGVIFAACQQYGFDFDELRDLWLKLADLGTLLRPGRGPMPSVLDGDLRFLGVLQSELHRLMKPVAGQARTGSNRPAVDLQLTATLVEPVRSEAASEEETPLPTERYGAGFHFRHAPEQTWRVSDFPPEDDEQALEAASWRLALAARATSSFPAAFEAAVVRARRPPTFAGGARDEREGRLVDMFGMFSDSQGARRPSDEGEASMDADDFVVADGGILDNIPLGRAIQAVVAAPADHRSARKLVYVQPGAPDAAPPESTGADTDQVMRRATSAVLKGTLRSRATSETIIQDIADLQDHNRAVARARGVRREVFHPIEEGKSLVERGQELMGLYPVLRASLDAQRMRRLLDDPLDLMGEDPFPVLGGDEPQGRWRAPLGQRSAAERQSLDVILTVAFRGQLDRPGLELQKPEDASFLLAASPGPLRRVTSLLLEWSRYLEGATEDADLRRDIGVVKSRLYRLSLFTSTVVERYRRLAWVTRAVQTDRIDASWVDGSRRIADRLLDPEGDPALIVRSALEDGTLVQEYQAELCGVLDGIRAGTVTPPTEEQDRPLLVALLDAEVAEFDRLWTLARNVSPGSTDGGPGDEAGESLHRALRDASPTVENLAALEVCCLAEYIVGSPHSSEIGFERISAAAPTPLAEHFTALTGPDGTLTVDNKLAGNELANFSAFLRPGWRSNDWMWGRMDAVPTVVKLLVSPDSVRSWLGALAPDERAPAVEALVTGGDPAWRPFLHETVWQPRESEIGEEWGQLLADGSSDGDVGELQAALIARRQWEILSCELARAPGIHPECVDGRVRPDALLATVGEYSVGREQVGGRSDMEVLTRAATLAGQSAQWHLDGGAIGDKSVWWGKGAATAVAMAARIGLRLSLRSEKALSEVAGETGGAGSVASGRVRRWAVGTMVLTALVVAVTGAIAWSVATDFQATVVTAVAVGVPMLVLLGGVFVLGRPAVYRWVTVGAGVVVGAAIGAGVALLF